jgi:hypothetical protein
MKKAIAALTAVAALGVGIGMLIAVNPPSVKSVTIPAPTPIAPAPTTPTPTPPSSPSLSQIASQSMTNSVKSISCQGLGGTAFEIQQNGVPVGALMTATHVAGGCSDSAGNDYPNDMTLMAPDPSLTPLAATNPQPGEQVAILGETSGPVLGQITNTAIDAPCNDGPLGTIPGAIIIQGEAHPGDSGAPVINTDGTVVGILLCAGQVTSIAEPITSAPTAWQIAEN